MMPCNVYAHWSSLYNEGEDKDRVAQDGNKAGQVVWTSERETETGVTVTTGRWREIQEDWEVACASAL